MATMKIAFIAQPRDPVLPPRQNSIGIIIYEIACSLARYCDVTVYAGDDRIQNRMNNIEGVHFRHISMVPDTWLLRFLNRISSFF